MNEQKPATWQELQDAQESHRAFLADEHARLDAETAAERDRLRAINADMLDALRLCADVLDGTRGVGERPSFINIDGARILARAAIAKATGEEARA